ncbi:hypothetical protein A3K64_03110 [Candidatus Micrarchaeota archaeon RBG_16_36_9]|nr:MAG: hypothetical protein A3K64_03110 [Candidatus Micrarchaeota archaeon RBG_16_36_9]
MQTQERKINLNITKVIHSPTLSTVLMVEEALRKQDVPTSLEGLKRALPKKVMDQSLRMILAYLENKGSILIGPKGISWIANDKPEFLRMIKKARVIDA